MEKVDRLSGGSDDCVAAMKMAGRERWWMRLGSSNGVDKKNFLIRRNPTKTGGIRAQLKFGK